MPHVRGPAWPPWFSLPKTTGPGIIAAITWLALGFHPHDLAGETAANVLLVINKNSPISRKIGQYYARKRALPEGNVCALKVAVQEEISRDVYESRIAKPIAKFLRRQKLTEQILYIVTTKGVPLKIEGSSGLDGDAASVDSELTLLYQRLKGKRRPLAGPIPNPFFRETSEIFVHPAYPIYLVTRLTGYELEDVRRMIDRSLEAKNRGLFVLDLKSESNEEGNNWLREAARRLPQERVLLDESRSVVYGVEDVIGYAAWGSNDRQRAREKRRLLDFRWLPGAIMTEYVSSNGRTFQQPPDSWTITTWGDKERYFRGSPQTLTADYIREGVSGASGHVYEPYLQYTPRPNYLLPAYFGGRNLAESYYLSIPALSWMTIVVGDPLCRIAPPNGDQ